MNPTYASTMPMGRVSTPSARIAILTTFALLSVLVLQAFSVPGFSVPAASAATTTKTWTFDTTAENWAFVAGGTGSSGGRLATGGVGNTGNLSITHDSATATTLTGRLALNTTWQTLGVPAGDTVSSVQLTTISQATTAFTGTASPNNWAVQLRDPSAVAPTTTLLPPQAEPSPEGAFTAVTSGTNQAVPAALSGAATPIQFVIQANSVINPSATINMRWDSITISITHAAPASIAASPTSLSLRTRQSGTSGITWNTGSGASGSVCVSRDATPEVLFAVGPSGVKNATWIQAPSTYTFNLYSGACGSTLLAGPATVTTSFQAAAIQASPATFTGVPALTNQTSAVTWDTGGTGLGQVFASRSDDGGVTFSTEVLFVQGDAGTKNALFIKHPGATRIYRFNLYQGTTQVTVIATTNVTVGP